MKNGLLVCLIMALAAIPASASAGTQQAWLATHATAWPLDTEAPQPALPARLRDARVILLGEIHGLAHGQAADLTLLKALHRQAGVRLYLGEFDAAQADAFNRFLVDGDRRGLDAVFAGWRARGLQWANVEFRDKLIAIAQWNARLPAAERVRFLGADEVQDRDAYCRWLAGRLGLTPGRTTVARLAAELRDPARCVGAGSIAAAALAQARGLDPVTVDGIAALVVDAAHPDREARIAANVQRFLAARRGRLYGMWGLYHVVQAEVNGTVTMALHLLRAGVRVRSIAMLNIAGEMMIPTASPDGGISYGTMAYTVDSPDAALVNGVEPFVEAVRGPLTLFLVKGRGSPFLGSDALSRVGGRLGQVQPFVIDPATARSGFWADAILMSRGSAATQPWP